MRNDDVSAQMAMALNSFSSVFFFYYSTNIIFIPFNSFFSSFYLHLLSTVRVLYTENFHQKHLLLFFSFYNTFTLTLKLDLYLHYRKHLNVDGSLQKSLLMMFFYEFILNLPTYFLLLNVHIQRLYILTDRDKSH